MTDARPGARPGGRAVALPGLIDDVKDDLGIPPEDTSHDAWLARRIAGVWSRMETWTARTLASPAELFIDDWSGVVEGNAHKNLPPVLAYPARASVFLRVFPVLAVTALELNGQASDPASVAFDWKSGKLLAAGTSGTLDLGCLLLTNRAKITYSAGWPALPADLYEVIMGALAPAWAARNAQASGIGAGISAVNVQDVGSVDFGNPNSFIDSASKRGVGGTQDPSPLPVTTPVATAPLTPPLGAFVGTAPPSFPSDNALWWNSSAGQGGGALYIYYNDGTGRQWVPASATAWPVP
jgi:hypothetical protein